MDDEQRFGDVSVRLADGFVALVTIERPPDNYFDVDLVGALADAYEHLDIDPDCRCIVLGAAGKNFCAGARLGDVDPTAVTPGRHLYDEAVHLFAAQTPVVAAVQGAAIGGGLGLALTADFRVTSTTARFAANFARLGFHHGFGLTVTLPGVVGQQRANEMLFTGRRIDATTAHAWGLVDRLVEPSGLADAAMALAREIAGSAPLAVRSIRQTMRAGLVGAIVSATTRERAEQQRLMATADFAEGVAATRDRRPPSFQAR